MAQPSVQDWLDSFHAEEAKVWVEDPGKFVLLCGDIGGEGY
jgi:hypothetical protein